MVYNLIRPAAFVPRADLRSMPVPLHTLPFPHDWRQAVLELHKHGRGYVDRIKHIPLRRLNAAIRAVAPDLVSVTQRVEPGEDTPWIYANTEYGPAVMAALVAAWLRDMQPDDEAFQEVSHTFRELDPTSLTLRWEPAMVDLLDHTMSPGGTIEPHQRLFRLLPEAIAERIEKLPPYQHDGERVTFYRVATDYGAELMSWPPREYTPSDRDGRASTWSYSGYIKITLHTVPFSPIPRLHLHTGIRRWVRKPDFWMPANRRITVYLRTTSPWLIGSPMSARFATDQLAYDRKTSGVRWEVGGPAGMLKQLERTKAFPPANELRQDPLRWLTGNPADNVTAGVAYHTMMGYHGVGAGLMPMERQRLTEWAAAAFEPEFVRAPDFVRSSLSSRVKRTLKQRPSMPTGDDATADKIAATTAKIDEVTVENALQRRTKLGAALDGELVIHILDQTPQVRAELVRAAEQHLGLQDHRTVVENDAWQWHTPQLAVSITAERLSALGRPLGDGTAPRRGKETEKAVNDRRALIAAKLASVPKSTRLVFVELEGRKAFTPATDPKVAIRLGCADAACVTQFITPVSRTAGYDDDDDEGALPHRALAAFADGLRQLGARLVPDHSLGEAIPSDLNQIAFWMVKRNSDGRSKQTQFTPVAILLRHGESRVMGRALGMDSWVSYPELLLHLTNRIRGADERKRAQQQADTARFLRKTLFLVRNEPTLVLSCAQNARTYWDWLQNKTVCKDAIKLGELPIQRLDMHGKNLRHVRIRTSDRNETPQWWAPEDDSHAGFASGLWVPDAAPDDNRVFASTANKSRTLKLSRDATKLTRHANAQGKSVINPKHPAQIPDLLEIATLGLATGDNPETWAMYVHQQRFPDDVRDGLHMPLALHLAQLAADYALTQDEEAEQMPTSQTPADDPDQPLDAEEDAAASDTDDGAAA